MRIARSTAQQLAIAAQGLDGRWPLPRGKEGVARTIERLGYVQIDTIAVVQRAHHHTLWSRRPDYHPGLLHELQARDRRVFEYWTHAASYLPMGDYRYYAARMRARAGWDRTRQFLEAHAALVRDVLARIRSEGPLGSADFAAPPGRKRGSWWDWKPAKQALEVLFDTGELMVAERRNFQRRYDLTERVLPTNADTTPPDRPEQARFALRRLLTAQGVTDLNYWWLRDKEALGRALTELIDAGRAVEVRIEGVNGRPYYALTKSLEAAGRRRREPRGLHILSPFDGLLMWRRRVAALFGFECKLECYLPAEKRKYGYFCLPILWGRRFVGRLDAKADRKAACLVVRKLMFERGFRDYDAVLPLLAAKLRKFAKFNECAAVRVEQTQPRKVKRPLERAIGA
jgi:uncharacterized protein YcaQ